MRLLDCTTTAVIHLHEGELSFHVVDGEGCVAPRQILRSMEWPEEIWHAISEQEKPLVIPSLDQETQISRGSQVLPRMRQSISLRRFR